MLIQNVLCFCTVVLRPDQTDFLICPISLSPSRRTAPVPCARLNLVEKTVGCCRRHLAQSDDRLGKAESVRLTGFHSVDLFVKIDIPIAQDFTQENGMSILESDWKKFKELRKIALDRFCQGVLADAKAISQHGALSAHARYGMLYGLIRDRNKDMAQAFDRYSQSRSSALTALRLYVMHDLLTDEELSVLSEDAQSCVSNVDRQPYELEWVDEIVSQD